MRTFEKYPAYKDSGVEWLGEIPEGWEVKRMKYLTKIRYGLGQPPKENDNGLPLIRATNVERGVIIEKELIYVDPDDIPWDRCNECNQVFFNDMVFLIIKIIFGQHHVFMLFF